MEPYPPPVLVKRFFLFFDFAQNRTPGIIQNSGTTAVTAVRVAESSNRRHYVRTNES